MGNQTPLARHAWLDDASLPGRSVLAADTADRRGWLRHQPAAVINDGSARADRRTGEGHILVGCVRVLRGAGR